MTKIDKPQFNKQEPLQQPSKGSIVQQFPASGSALPTPQPSKDVEKVQGGNAKPSPKPR